MKRKNYNKKKKEAKVEEPEVEYKGKDIIIFKNFEQGNEWNSWENAGISPEEHIRMTTELIQMVFADKLKKKFKPGRVYFKKA